MAEYEPLLAKAVLGLTEPTKNARESIYVRARTALIGQLGRMVPPVLQEDIDREEVALYKAIVSVEDKYFSYDRLDFDMLRFNPQNRQLREFRHSYENLSQASKQPISRRDLADVASPSPSLNRDGKLDAGPNTKFDRPAISNEIITLPVRQGAIIRTILSDLPRNSPKFLTVALEGYRDELLVRGTQPILGLLRDMVAVIAAALGNSEGDQEWLSDGLKAAFHVFRNNHEALLTCFPLDLDRQKIYNSTNVDSEEATGKRLYEPFQNVTATAQIAYKVGIATDDFKIVVQKMAEFARIVASLPPDPPPHGEHGKENLKENTSNNARKHIVLSGLGFLERAYNIAGSTASLVATTEGQALMIAFSHSIQSLASFVHF